MSLSTLNQTKNQSQSAIWWATYSLNYDSLKEILHNRNIIPKLFQ